MPNRRTSNTNTKQTNKKREEREREGESWGADGALEKPRPLVTQRIKSLKNMKNKNKANSRCQVERPCNRRQRQCTGKRASQKRGRTGLTTACDAQKLGGKRAGGEQRQKRGESGRDRRTGTVARSRGRSPDWSMGLLVHSSSSLFPFSARLPCLVSPSWHLRPFLTLPVALVSCGRFRPLCLVLSLCSFSDFLAAHCLGSSLSCSAALPACFLLCRPLAFSTAQLRAGQAAETSQNRVCKRELPGWLDTVLIEKPWLHRVC